MLPIPFLRMYFVIGFLPFLFAFHLSSISRNTLWTSETLWNLLCYFFCTACNLHWQRIIFIHYIHRWIKWKKKDYFGCDEEQYWCSFTDSDTSFCVRNQSGSRLIFSFSLSLQRHIMYDNFMEVITLIYPRHPPHSPISQFCLLSHHSIKNAKHKQASQETDKLTMYRPRTISAF